MKEFPENIIFKYPWRNYQKRVLDELEEHLDDNHLHVIAPPGSGKTVLGLEVMLRLNKPTLILAPTIAIKNQWIERFCDLFLQVDIKPNWISNNIKEPKFITVSTYQGLHAACTNSGRIEDECEDFESEDSEIEEKTQNDRLEYLIKSFQSVELGCIIVDEAHHLKNEWWKSLIQIKTKLSTIVVGLTATPPYDVSYSEWSRYIELNGPVDAEISVPELIKEGDLCPHQDYVLFSKPTQEELSHIQAYRSNIIEVFFNLSRDKLIIEQLGNSSVFKTPENHLEWIYGNMEYYSSILIFLNFNNIPLQKNHFKITGNKQSQLPTLNEEWLEIFLSYYLKEFEDPDNNIVHHQNEVTSLLRRSGILERGKINFTDDLKIESFLTASIGKLDSIKRITKFESNLLKDNLRQVVLCDFIRKEFLSDTVKINKIGVIPIFETLRREFTNEIKLGVLTGSLIIIPKSAHSKLSESANKFGTKKIKTTPLPFDPDYFILNIDEKLKSDIVQIVTQIFQSGDINVLVGTKSLLGEGWDAPSINVLILASFVGSFVLSNQMRGRAIRTVRTNPDKTSNIWHLVCHDPTNKNGGKDLDILKRRFKGFVGISERENKTIENGINRLIIPNSFNEVNIESFNERMFKSASERDILRSQWYEAIENGTTLIEEIKIPFEEEEDYQRLKKLYLNKTIKYVFVELGIGLTIYAQEFLENLPRYRNLLRTPDGRWSILALFGLGALAFFGRQLYKAFKLFVKYRDISKDIEKIGKSLLQTLVETKYIQTDISELKVNSLVNGYGEVFCHLKGGTTFEKGVFIKSLQEIVTPVNNPRYLIIRKSNFFSLINQKDYHSVPEVLAKHKSPANKLLKYWKVFVGNCELIFTRCPEGRAVLLKARFNSLASEFQKNAERTNRWK